MCVPVIEQTFDSCLSTPRITFIASATFHLMAFTLSAHCAVRLNRLYVEVFDGKKNLCVAADYNGIVSVIHLNKTHGCLPAGLQAPVLFLWYHSYSQSWPLSGDLAVNPRESGEKQAVAEELSVSLWPALRRVSCESVCGTGISIRPWLSRDHGYWCRIPPLLLQLSPACSHRWLAGCLHIRQTPHTHTP